MYAKESEYLDLVLNAAGTNLRHYTSPRTLDLLHEAIRKVMSESYAEGYKASQSEAQK